MPQRNTIEIIINATDNASRILQGLGENTQVIGAGMVTAFGAATAAIAGATTAMVVKGLADFSTFERGMNEVFTLMPGASQAAFDEMESQIQGFSARFGMLSSDVIPAVYQALSAGVPQDNIFAFMEVAGKAAIGGVTTLETAVDGITSVVNAYGSEIIDAQTASDQMFRAVVLGKTTFEELAASMFQVNPVAASMGVEFTDVMAAIAAITAQGVPTSVAMTQMRGALEELGTAGTDAADAFEMVAGKSFRDFIAEGHNMSEAMQVIEQAADQLGVPINELFSRVEASNAVLALTGNNAERFATFLEDVGNSAGATEAAFEQMNQGIGRALERLGATMLNLSTNIGKLVAPLVEPLVRGLSDVVQILANVIGGQFGLETLTDALGEVPAAFRPLLRILMPLAAGFRQLASDLDPNNPNSLFGALEIGVPFFDVMTIAMRRVLRAMGAGSEVIDDVVKTFTKLREVFTTIVRTMQRVLTPIVEWIRENVELQDVLIAVGVAIASFVVPAILSIATAILPIVGTFAALVAGAALLRRAWETNFLGIQDIVENFGNAWNGAVNAFKMARIVGEDTLGAIEAAVIAFAASFGVNLQPVFDALHTFIDFLSNLWNAAEEGGLGGAATFIYDTLIAPIVETITTYIGSGQLWDTVKALGTSIFEALSTGIPAVATWVMDNIITPIYTNIVSAVESADWIAIGGTILDLLGQAFQLASDIGAWVNEHLVAPIVSFLLEVIETTDWGAVGQSLLDAISTGLAAVADFAGWLYDNFIAPLLENAVSAIENTDWSQVGANIVNAIGAALKATFDFVAWIIDSIFNPTVESAEGATEGIDWSSVGSAIMNAIKGGILGIFNFVTWLNETIFTPLIAGATDAINQLDWSSIGNNIMNAVANALPNIAEWVSTNIIQPVSNALSNFNPMNMFGGGGGGGTTRQLGGTGNFGGISAGTNNVPFTGVSAGIMTIPGFQFGGEVSAGQPITVGHGGVETFIPETNGQIMSATDTAASSRQQPIQITFVFQRSITDQEARESAYKLRRELQAQGIQVEGTF